MPLDARKEAEELRKLYESDTKQSTARVLLTGESGTGKTYGCRYAPWPLHIDSFDPGGTLSLRDQIIKGNIIADTAYENEDPFNPSAWAKWTRAFDQRLVGGYFNSIATYVIDSATTWSDACMNYMQSLHGGAGKVPQWEKDYHPQKTAIRNYLRKCMNLPCHFIMTAHLQPQKDNEGNVIARRVMFSGQGAITIPLLFDEIWVTEIVNKSDGPKYMIRTRSNGMYSARSRLSSDGLLNEQEEYNFKRILKKVKINSEDKPNLFKEQLNDKKAIAG